MPMWSYVKVLQGMAVETRVKVPQGTKAAGPLVALTRRQLELAIALVQRISDEVMQVRRMCTAWRLRHAPTRLLHELNDDDGCTGASGFGLGDLRA